MKKILQLIFLIIIYIISINKVLHADDSLKYHPLVNLSRMWQNSEYWKVVTYDGHGGSGSEGRKYAADFYYSSKNRPDIYKNADVGLSGNSILAPISGNIYIHLFDGINLPLGGQFPMINAVRVFQGLDPIPYNCFSMVDSLNVTIRVDMSLIIDVSSYRTNFSHLQIKSSYFNSTVIQKIRNAIRKLYNRTAVGSPRRVAVSVGSSTSVGEQTGTLNNWGLASEPHLHFQVFEGTGYSESSPYLGTAANLSTTSYTIEGQTILNLNYEGAVYSKYHYPAMMRRTFQANNNVVVNNSWNGQPGANLRNGPGGSTIISEIPNGTIGTILNATPITAILSSNCYLWYNIQYGTYTGWMAAEMFDLSGSTPQLQLAITPTTTQTVDWGQTYSFNFTVTSNSSPISSAYIGFSDPIRLMTMNVGPTNSSGQYSYSYTVPNGTANNTYTYNCIANKTGYQNSAAVVRYVQVNHSVALLPPPVLLYPGEPNSPGTVINTLTPTMQWQSVSGAIKYGLYIRNMATNVIIFDDSNFTGTSYTLPNNFLQLSTPYRWNMRTYNSANQPGQVSNHFYFQTQLPSGLIQSNTTIPSDYELYQNFPNPFNPATTIKFDIPKKSDIQIIIYDIRGTEVSNFSKSELPAGQYSYKFDGSNLSSGLYFCKLITNDYSKTIKLNLIK